MLICGQFIAKDLNLWSTLLFVHFEKLNFSNFWGPLNLLGSSKKSQLLDSWPLSMLLKTRPWMNLFKNIVLYLSGCSGRGQKHTYVNIKMSPTKSFFTTKNQSITSKFFKNLKFKSYTDSSIYYLAKKVFDHEEILHREGGLLLPFSRRKLWGWTITENIWERPLCTICRQHNTVKKVRNFV